MTDKRVIRAVYDEQTITVYQAYSKEIATTAVAAQTFVSPPFKIDRMTWIKPSFLWMMYRSGWATKEGQEHVLAIKIKRDGFKWALQNSCLATYDKDIDNSEREWKLKLKSSPVRIQWDPEKDIYLQPQPYKSIQIGLSGIAVPKYIDEWIVAIDDISSYCHEIHDLIKEDKTSQAKELLPVERVYTLPDAIARHISHSMVS